MKTIAISIDEATLAGVNRFLSRDGSGVPNRSALVRQALREFLRREAARAVAEEEGRILHECRDRLARQAEALVEEQATP